MRPNCRATRARRARPPTIWLRFRARGARARLQRSSAPPASRRPSRRADRATILSTDCHCIAVSSARSCAATSAGPLADLTAPIQASRCRAQSFDTASHLTFSSNTSSASRGTCATAGWTAIAIHIRRRPAAQAQVQRAIRRMVRPLSLCSSVGETPESRRRTRGEMECPIRPCRAACFIPQLRDDWKAELAMRSIRPRARVQLPDRARPGCGDCH